MPPPTRPPRRTREGAARRRTRASAARRTARRPSCAASGLLEPQADPADLDLVAVMHALALRDLRAVHHGAVRAAGVLDPPLADAGAHDGVFSGRSFVVHHDIIPGIQAERGHRAERQSLARTRAATAQALH